MRGKMEINTKMAQSICFQYLAVKDLVGMRHESLFML